MIIARILNAYRRACRERSIKYLYNRRYELTLEIRSIKREITAIDHELMRMGEL